MQVERFYLIGDKKYRCLISFKRMKRLVMRYDGENELIKVSVPNRTPYKRIDSFVFDNFADLEKRVSRKNANGPIKDGFYYWFGHQAENTFPNKESLEKAMKKQGLGYLEMRVRYYESLMGITKPYKVRIRTMKTRYGVNSKQTYSITFTTSLLHYSPEIIDSVVVHELCHHFVRDHSKKFYAYVYKYFPNYKVAHTKLRKQIYE